MKLVDLADVLRPHVKVFEHVGRNRLGHVVGWKEMGRPRDYVRPTHIMVHHTASRTSIANDINYCNFNAATRPLANILLDRQGGVHICAAGPTNTNGKGRDTWGGGVPDDQMNDWAIGLELCNDGVGEPYPIAQQDALLTVCSVLSTRYSIPVGNCRGHFEWAPTRKIDPSGPSLWAPKGGKWDMNLFRVSVAEKKNPTFQRKKMNYFDDPVRIFDSRDWPTPFRTGVHTMPLGSFPQIPANATDLALTVTAVTIGYPGFVTLWSGKSPNVPKASNLNYSNIVVANTTAVKLFTRSFKIFVSSDVHLVFDVIGWQ